MGVLGWVNDSGHFFDFNTCERKALAKSNSKSQKCKSLKTGGVASAWLKSVSETVIAHKMLSHWNCLLLFGICSMFPKGNGSEYDKNCCL